MKRIIVLLIVSGLNMLFAQHSATLSWTWAQGTGDPATGFHVWRSTVAGQEQCPTCMPVATVAPGTFTFIDTAVVAGQTLFYTITAFNTAGDSTPSNEATAVIPFQTPAVPTGLTITTK